MKVYLFQALSKLNRAVLVIIQIRTTTSASCWSWTFPFECVQCKMATAASSKRSADESSNVPAKKKNHWSQGLLASMNDPNLIVESDDRIVIIKDKYPKVK